MNMFNHDVHDIAIASGILSQTHQEFQTSMRTAVLEAELRKQAVGELLWFWPSLS